MKRSLLFLILASLLIGACAPGQPLLVNPPTQVVVPGIETPASTPFAAPGVEATPSPNPANTAVAPATTAPPITTAQATLPAATSAVTSTAAAAAPATPAAQAGLPAATSAVTSTATGAAATPVAQAHTWQPSERLPLDPKVREGVLPNGMTYILSKNSQPQNRAELRLVVNAGSVLEADDQKGLAHFLEHMLFNGTCRFPKQSIKDFLESNGMTFGADLNASTSFDQTVYVLRIPLDDPKVLDTGLSVLVDWASCATLDQAEMNRERGVIVEEHRVRDLSAQGRLSDQIVGQLLAGSQYAARVPIGDMNIVQNAPVEALRRFYTDWYRPDLMAVVAVGDFDVDRVEQMVRDKFSAVPAKKDGPARPGFNIPDYTGTHYLVASDPENPTTTVDLYVRQPAPAYGTVALYRDALAERLFYTMLRQRYTDLAQEGNAPFTSADTGTASLVRPAQVSVITARTQETNTVPALQGIMTEVERVRRYGFTESELARARTTVLEQYRRLYDQRDTTDTSQLVQEYVRHFLTREDVPGIAVENDLANQLVPQITLAEVNQKISELAGPDNRLAVAVTPQKAGLTPPTQEQLAAVIQGLGSLDIKPYQEPTTAAQLMPVIPQPAAVISRTTIPEIGVTEVTFENGLRLVMKPTNFKTDEVIFTGISRGGSSLLPDADVPAARLAGNIVSKSGVGQFTQAQLERLLAGKTVTVTPAIRELSQRIDGSTSPRDLETALQLVNLYVTQPRMDPGAAKAVKDAMAAQLANRSLSPDSALQDALTSLLYGNSVRWNAALPLDAVKSLDPDRAFQIYKERFSDVDDFTFVFTGNFDENELISLAQKYLGTLPGTGGTNQWKDLMPPVPAGVQTRDIHQGSDNRGTAAIIYPGAFDATPEDQVRLKIISNILDMRLTSELRQKLSGTYSPSVDASVDLWPTPRYAVGIEFTADPARMQELLTATFAQVDALRTQGPTDAELSAGKEQVRRGHEEELRQNQYWRTALVNYALDPARDPRSVLSIDGLAANATAADIQAAVQEFMKADRYIQVVLFPESSSPLPTTVTERVGAAAAGAR